MKINNRIISPKNVFIIAELSANHNQDISLAKETIYAMKESGADAVKLQTNTADTLTINCKNKYFTINNNSLWDGQTYYDLYKKAYTPWEWHLELKELSDKLGLTFFSTPFDKSAVDFLEKIDVPCYKIASFEITDIPLIEYTASKGKPMIISTGIATYEEINDAVNACRKAGNNDIILLKCTSAYPAPIEDANLKMIPKIAKDFNVLTGLSDHTIGSVVPIAAVALGAVMVEKHFILNKNIDSPDKEFSMTPEEFSLMVKEIRNTEKALGKETYELTEKQKKGRNFARSLFVVKDIKKGEIFTEQNIRSIRPGDGLPPKYLNDIIGKTAKMDLERGTPLDWEHIL
jgi:pseudaminic acid synthase